MIMTKNNCSEKIANEIYAKNEKWFKEHDYRQITKQEGIVSGVNVPLSK
jgi:L-cysteine desulfidase